jgi:hypothetical protein
MEEPALESKNNEKITDAPVTEINSHFDSHQPSAEVLEAKPGHVHKHGHHHHNEQTFEEKLRAEANIKKAIRSTLQRKTNQFIKELNAQ